MSGDLDVIIPIPPYHYIHVLDKNTNITRTIVGPLTFFKKDHERLTKMPQPMITITPTEYCIIRNPRKKDTDGNIAVDKFGQVLLAYGDEEYRFNQTSFPLYPGEVLAKEVTLLTVIPPNEAILLSAVVSFTCEDGTYRAAGEHWLFEGPGVYLPRKEVEVISKRKAEMILANTALRLRALITFVDRTGTKRSFGETWLVKEVGAYMVGAYEECDGVVYAHHLDEKHALHVRAKKTHTDEFGKRRRHGEEWLITHMDAESHIPSDNEEVVDFASPIILRSDNYCVVCDPVDENGVPRIGREILVRGEKTFFLLPGERLKNGIQCVHVLGENEGIILRALESFHDESANIKRVAGEEWMLVGPMDYVPPITVEVVTVRIAIPLDENEGIYVRDKLSGQVRAVIGSTYMLSHNEELWEKKLPPLVEKLLMEDKDSLDGREDYRKRSASGDKWDATRVVTYRVPHNSAIQVYDYKGKKARVVFGPERVMLGPDEQFTQLSLSGGRHKRPNMIKTICILLGPNFCIDILVVETADHARLSIQLSYNWHFELSEHPTQAEGEKLFSVPDFIGDFCKALAARVRGAVASVNFDTFHKNSATIIRQSVFGRNADGKIRDYLIFKQNNLVVTNVDVQSVEPVDQRTCDALQKSVQLAIEITSNSQEAAARHEAERLEQEARGKLERQRIQDEATAEEARRGLLELQIQLAALESSGQAKAEAQSRADAALITTQAEVQKAKLESQADEIRTNGELRRLKLARDTELEYIEKKNALELMKKKQEIEIETSYFLKRVEAIGAENLRFIACAGQDRDVKMLRALNLKSTLITDGRTPINLLNATAELIGQASSSIHSQSPSGQTNAFVDA